MFVTRKDIIFLRDLSTTTKLVSVDSIPAAFKNDFQRFFFGKTLVKENDKLFAYPHDAKRWAIFMFQKYNG